MSMSFLSRFSRITSSGRVFLPQLDGLRFIAIAWVFAFHVNHYVEVKTNVSPDAFGVGLTRVITAGHLGVLLFFCISGFILALPFAEAYHKGKAAMSLKKYFVRRVTRLEPPYLIHLLLVFLAVGILPLLGHRANFPEQIAFLTKHVAASSVYLHQIIFNELPGPNVVLWSLEIEIQFYLLAPLLSQIFRWKNLVGRRAVMLAAMLVSYWISVHYHDNFRVSHSILGHLQYFLIGFLFADRFVASGQQLPQSAWWDLGFLCVIAALWLNPGVQWELNPLTPLFMFVVLCAGFQGRFTLRVLSLTIISTIGGMCYTIYMYHYLLISLIGRLTLRFATGNYLIDLLVHLITHTAVVLLVCAPLFLLFERPFMARDWHVRAWKYLRGRPDSPAPADALL